MTNVEGDVYSFWQFDEVEDDSYQLPRISRQETGHAKEMIAKAPPAEVLHSTPPRSVDDSSETDTKADRKALLPQMMSETKIYKYLMLSCDVEDLKNRVLVLVNQLGFTDFGFTLMETLNEKEGLLFSGPVELIEAYYHDAYYEHDMLCKYLAENTDPIFQSALFDYAQSAPFTTEEIKCNRELAGLLESFGYNDAYVLPLESHYGGRCLLFIYGAHMSRSVFRQKVEACADQLELLCCVIDYICSTRFRLAIEGSGKFARIKLTPRALELLKQLSVNDHNLNQAAEVMNISVKTANVHVASAKKAFGVSTSTGAVFNAVKYGFIPVGR